MSDTGHFHELHGPNVILMNSNKEAMWHVEKSGGLLFTAEPLSPGVSIELIWSGSGRVRLGCTTADPMLYKSGAPDNFCDIRDFESMNEVRFHKRECSVKVFVNKAGNKVTSSCGFLKYDKVIHRNKLVWVVIHVMFGDVRTAITDINSQQTVMLSEVHGVNIRLNEERTEASTIHQSPGAYCLIGAPLQCGENIFLRCQPTKDDGRPVSNFHIKLLISEQGPDQITGDDFSLTDLCVSEPNLTVVKTFNKVECHGEVRVSHLINNRLEFRSANNEVNSQSLWSGKKTGVWVYLELYRVHVKLFSQSENEMFRLQRRLSTRSNVSYHYTHFTLGSRSKTLHSIQSHETSVHSAHGDYIDMGHRTSSCPADLDRGELDSVDGVQFTSDDMNTEVKTLYVRGNSSTDNVDAVGATPIDPTCVHCEAKHAGIKCIDKDLSELRCAIRSNWTELIFSLQTEATGDLLFEHGIITHMELDKIRKTLTRDGQEANRLILDILFRKGISRTLLSNILTKTGDTHLQEFFFK